MKGREWKGQDLVKGLLRAQKPLCGNLKDGVPGLVSRRSRWRVTSPSPRDAAVDERLC